MSQRSRALTRTLNVHAVYARSLGTVGKYVATGKMRDVSDALDELLGGLADALPAGCLHHANTFRVRYCYVRETCGVLRRHLTTLRALFVRYAGGNPDGQRVCTHARLGYPLVKFDEP